MNFAPPAIDVAGRNRQIIDRARREHGKRAASFDVVFAARENLFRQPGGDTELAVNLKAGLEGLGYSVGFHTGPFRSIRCRLTHIINCEPFLALHSVHAGKPYVVTPLYEDTARYECLSWEVVGVFRRYIERGDPGEIRAWIERKDDSRLPAPSRDLDFLFSNAEAVFVTGREEGDLIARGYPSARNIVTARLGFTRPADADAASPRTFASEFGVDRFVLCVGRLENRKNQLMLLEALKDDDVPVVFVNSSTVQPEYEDLCRKFQRKGKTIFTGRISREMLHSAYKAAKVHVLPSWYELPGLVSLEAAWFGCNVVASDWGTLRDYLGERAFYCDPRDPRSIREAVLRAMNAPADPGCRGMLEGYGWKAVADRVASVYEKVISAGRSEKWRKRFQAAGRACAVEAAFVQDRSEAMRIAQEQPRRALDCACRLLEHRKGDPVTLFIQGLAFLSLARYAEAENCFVGALARRPRLDVRCNLYLSLAASMRGNHDVSIAALRDAKRLYPFLPPETDRLIGEYLARSIRERRGREAAPCGVKGGGETCPVASR